MEVILLETIGKLGNLGDKKNVKSGYGRNYLIPYGKAVVANAANLASFEERRVELEKAAAALISAANKRAQALEDSSVTILAKAGDEGKLFGSIGVRDIAQAISSDAVTIEKGEVRLPEGALRHLGEYDITLHLHSEVNVIVKVIIEATT